MTLNVTYTPDLQNSSSNASQQLQRIINQTLSTAFINITNGGVRPDIISFVLVTTKLVNFHIIDYIFFIVLILTEQQVQL